MKSISIARKISLILSIHVIATVLLIICGLSLSSTISTSFTSIRKEVPRLASIAKLVLESQKLVMIVSEMQSAENNYIRKALAQDFMRQRFLWEDKICRHFPAGIPENISNIFKLLREILYKTEDIDTYIRVKLVAESRIRAIVDRVAILEESAKREALSEKSAELLLEIFSLFNRSAIEHVPSTIRVFRKKYLFAISELEKELWKYSSPSSGVKRIEEELWHFGVDDGNIFENARKKLECDAAISDLIITTSFLTEEILNNTELFASLTIKKIERITYDAQKVTMRNVFLPLLVMSVGVFFSIFLIFNLRYNVGGRLHKLKEELRSPDTVTLLPVEGKDEITAISLAVNFFIEKIRLREKQLLESNEGLEKRVNKRTWQLQMQNISLQQEMRKSEEAQGALAESEEKFRLLAENIQLALIFFEINSASVSYTNRICREFFGSNSLASLHDLFACIDSQERFRVVRRVLSAYKKDTLQHEKIFFHVAALTKRVLFVTFILVKDHKDSPLRVILVAEDVTRRLQDDKKIREHRNRLKILYSKLVTAQEEERRKLAALLHDDIGPSLGAVKFGVEAAKKGGKEARESLDVVVRLVKEIGGNVRRIQSELRPLIIDDLGLLAALDWYCSGYRKIYRHIVIEENIAALEENIPDKLKITLFRIIQEAFNNIAKHSGATYIRLKLRSSDGIFLRVDDNGCGILLESIEIAEKVQSSGLGLISMRERAELSGGVFVVESSSDGTSVICHWPLEAIG